jgi:hypothetical protein
MYSRGIATYPEASSSGGSHGPSKVPDIFVKKASRTQSLLYGVEKAMSAGTETPINTVAMQEPGLTEAKIVVSVTAIVRGIHDLCDSVFAVAILDRLAILHDWHCPWKSGVAFKASPAYRDESWVNLAALGFALVLRLLLPNLVHMCLWVPRVCLGCQFARIP